MNFIPRILACALLSLGLGPTAGQHAVAAAMVNVPVVPMLADRAGKVVGPLALSPPGSYGSVAINVGNDVLVFNLNYDLDRNGVLASNGVTWQTSGPLIYASADCSGRAYVGFGNLGSRRPVAVLVQDGKWVAYVGDAGEPQQITAHSYLQAQGKCLATTAERKVVPVTDRLQLDAYGMPPFYVQ
jgi:hypothetical protein